MQQTSFLQMKWIFLFLLGGSFLMVVSSNSSSPWGMYRQNALHTGRSAYGMGPIIGSPVLKWLYPTGDATYGSAVVGPNEVVYFGSWDFKVYAINGTNGAVIWMYPTTTFVFSTPAIGNMGSIYIGGLDGKVYALNQTTGTLKWSFTTTATNVYSSPVVDHNEVVYVGADQLYAIDGITGVSLWNFTTGATTSSPTLTENGTLVIGGTSFALYDTIYAIDTTTRLLLWSKLLPSSLDFGSPSVGPQGDIFFGCIDSKLYALNGSDGTILWSYLTGGIIRSTPAIETDGTLYFGSFDNNVYALNGTDGSLKWSFITGDEVHSSPALGSDGILYIGSKDTKHYAIEMSTGLLVWNYTVPFPIYNPTSIGSSGDLYFGTSSAGFYALQAPPPNTPTPSMSSSSLSTPSSSSTHSTTPSTTTRSSTPSISFSSPPISQTDSPTQSCTRTLSHSLAVLRTTVSHSLPSLSRHLTTKKNSPSQKPTSTPKPKNGFPCKGEEDCKQTVEDIFLGGKVLCTDFSSRCNQQLLDDCKDGHCQSKIQYDIIMDETETKLYIPSAGGAILGSVSISNDTFPKGTTLTLTYHPGDSNLLLSDNSLNGCDTSDRLLSPGSIQIDAKDSKGNKIHHLQTDGLVIAMILPLHWSSQDLRDSCLASSDEWESDWDCDQAETVITGEKNSVVSVKRRFNHLTSFAVLLDTTSTCNNLWIASLALLLGIPLTLIFIALSVWRWRRGWLYGYQGESLNELMTKMKRMSPNTN